MIVGAEHGTTTQCTLAIDRCLEKCCREHAPLTLVNPDSEAICRGTFSRVFDDRIVIRVSRDEAPLSSERFCCVMFDYEDRRWAFCTSIVGILDGGERELVLAQPQQVVAERRRPAIRIAIPPKRGFAGQLSYSDATYLGHVVDVNIHGALLEFQDSVEDVKLSSQIVLLLCLDDDEVLVPAQVVRREREFRLGFAFDHAAYDRNGWKARLRLIMKKIDSDWLKSEGLKSDQYMYVDLSNVPPESRSLASYS